MKDFIIHLVKTSLRVLTENRDRDIINFNIIKNGCDNFAVKKPDDTYAGWGGGYFMG